MGDPHGPNNISKVSMVSSVRILTISSLSHLETNLWESCQDSSNDSPGAIFESRHDTMLRHPLHPYFSVVVYKQSYNNHSATIKIRKWHVEILRARSGLRSCSSNVLFSRSVLGVVVLSPGIQTLSFPWHSGLNYFWRIPDKLLHITSLNLSLSVS